MATPRTRPAATGFVCTECGWRTPRWVGRCAECQAWGSVVQAEATASSSAVAAAATAPGRVLPITEVDQTATRRLPSGIGEFDRVLGGGLVPGAAILLSGEPGVGKSTLLLAVAARAASARAKVLYVSAEESLAQVRLRAERTGALMPDLWLSAETDLGAVLAQIEQVAPRLIVLDSVQTVAASDTAGFAGSPSQVREVSAALVRVAKQRGIPVLLVGHVTKDGQIAGPRMLEHLVDVVCQVEGDRHTALRFVRAVKNRFGPTDEVGCFEMTGDGVREVTDPSDLFLSRGQQPVSGTCVAVTVEGRRALPVEVQALVTKTEGTPRRVVNGIDGSRLAMLLAVLQQRAGVVTAGLDVYVSTVGGVRIGEPAVDLAVCLAITSAVRDVPLPADLCAVGEVGLAGELRPAPQWSRRESEARRLGFTRVIGPDAAKLQQAIAQAGLPGV